LLNKKFKNNISNSNRILSPSDFGLHNTISEKKKLYFLDFEYFGWDDPIKLICDFFWHPGNNMSKKLKNRLPLIHLKDFIMLNEHESYYAEIGNGNLDIKNIVKEAELSGCKWYIVEQDECQGDPFISIETSFNNLLQLVN